MNWLYVILSGAGGALLTAVVALFMWRKTRVVRRVECAVDPPDSLLTISSEIADKLTISYDGREVTSSYLFSMTVVNTGTVAVDNLPLLVKLGKGSKIISWASESRPRLGFEPPVEESRSGGAVSLKIPLLNPTDRLSLKILSIDNEDPEIMVGIRMKDVDTRVFYGSARGRALVGLLSRTTLLLLAISAIPWVGAVARAQVSHKVLSHVYGRDD